MSYTTLDALKGVHSYPVQAKFIERVSFERALTLETEFTTEILNSSNFKLAEADILLWVSTAPNIQEGGIQIGIIYSDRVSLRARANAVYNSISGTGAVVVSIYGDKGDTV